MLVVNILIITDYYCYTTDDQSRGYGFIQYGSYFNALKAIEGINGTLIEGNGRGIKLV